MARILDVTFDCHHPASLARFWAATLDGYDIAHYDDVELERLAAQGIADIEDDPSVLVESPDSPLRLWFTRVPEAKVVKNRVHLDLAAADVDAEVERLTNLGASVLHLHDDGAATLADPEGNELCVFPVA